MFGSHLSVAGGLHKAVVEAQRLNFDTVQVFTANPRTFQAPSFAKAAAGNSKPLAKPLPDEVIAQWNSQCQCAGFSTTISHDSYLINLASPTDALWQKSMDLFTLELARCTALGINNLVTHPGAHTGSGEEAGLKRVAEALDIIHERIPKTSVITCLEITAGQGTCLGASLEHLARIIELVKAPQRLGVCLDTAHLFAAGYDFRGRKYAAFMRGVERIVGIERIKVWHLNDSKCELGGRVDRHEHIGHGTIGLEGFKPIVRDKRWNSVPKILETPKAKAPDGRDWDTVNLETLQQLM